MLVYVYSPPDFGIIVPNSTKQNTPKMLITQLTLAKAIANPVLFAYLSNFPGVVKIPTPIVAPKVNAIPL